MNTSDFIITMIVYAILLMILVFVFFICPPLTPVGALMLVISESNRKRG